MQPPTGTNASKLRSWAMPSVGATFILYLQFSQTTITELSLLLSMHITVVQWLLAQCTTHHFKLSSHERQCHSCRCRSRLGASLCEPHQCTCGNMVNTRGNHGLSCKRSAGKTLRLITKRSYLPCSVTSKTAIDQRTCGVT